MREADGISPESEIRTWASTWVNSLRGRDMIMAKESPFASVGMLATACFRIAPTVSVAGNLAVIGLPPEPAGGRS